MSLDLDWTLLDPLLSSRFQATLNRALTNSASTRPSFLGEISITSLSFGTQPPEVTIRHVGDIWTDFVSHDDVPPFAAVPESPYSSRTPAPPFEPTNLPASSSFSPAPGLDGTASLHHHHHHHQQHQHAHPSAVPFRSYTQFDDALPPHRIQGPPSVATPSLVGSTPASVVGPSLNASHQQWSAALASRGIRAAGPSAGGSGISMPTSPDSVSVPPSPGYFGYWQQQQQQQGNGGMPLPMSNLHHLYPPPIGAASQKGSFDAASSSLAGRGPRPESSASNILARSSTSDRLPPSSASPLRTAPLPPAPHRPPTSSRTTPPNPSAEHPTASPPSSSSSSTPLPSLQLHLSLHWPTTTFRLTLTTSLLINYPSPAFLSLPLQLSITGLVLRAGLILALEGDHRRAHICLTEDDLVPAPDHDEPFPFPTTGTSGPRAGVQNAAVAVNNVGGSGAGTDGKGKRPSAGLAILPSLTFESEVGQADKHALRNVGKVERFVAEVLRKGIEDELVFPNYYTVDLPP